MFAVPDPTTPMGVAKAYGAMAQGADNGVSHGTTWRITVAFGVLLALGVVITILLSLRG